MSAVGMKKRPPAAVLVIAWNGHGAAADFGVEPRTAVQVY